VASGRRRHVPLSLPPPAAPVNVPESAASKAESSIIAAGVPSGDRRGLFVAAAAVLTLAIAGFGYSRYTPAADVPASGLSAGAQNVVDPSGATNLMRTGDPIPPPEPMEAIAPVKAPPKAEPVTFPNASVPEPPPTGIHAPEIPAPIVEAPPPSPRSAPAEPAKKAVNKSEVF
jgi:hypothetical protein